MINNIEITSLYNVYGKPALVPDHILEEPTTMIVQFTAEYKHFQYFKIPLADLQQIETRNYFVSLINPTSDTLSYLVLLGCKIMKVSDKDEMFHLSYLYSRRGYYNPVTYSI